MLAQLQSLSDRLRPIVQYLGSGWRRKALTLFFVALTLADIGQILYTNREQLTAFEWDFRPIYFPIIALFFGLDLLVALYVWHRMLVKLANYNHFRKASKIAMYANLARRLPGSGWYIASRSLLYAEEGIPKTTSSLLSGLELALFMCSGSIVTLLTLPFWVVPDGAAQIGALLIILPLTLFFANPKILNWFWKRFTTEQITQQLTWRDTISWIGLQIFTWILGGCFLWGIINLIWPLPALFLVACIGAWAFAGTVSLVGFISFSFFGLREVTLGLLLAAVIPIPVALVVAIGVRLFWLAGELSAALISLLL